MCTRVLWQLPGQPVLIGRNMDWREDMHSNMWVMPRGAQRRGMGEADPNPLKWTAAYGSVVTTGYDIATTDGVNEKGLGAHTLWLAESDFGTRDAKRPGLSASMWPQYFLDCFATVAEAVEAIRTEQMDVRPQDVPGLDISTTVHLALDDATGDSAVIEYLDGAPVVHHGREHTVMTNSPPFDQQTDQLKQYEGFGGEQPLPGTTEPADRFVRASYYVQRLPPADTADTAYAELLSVMRNAAQPFGTVDPVRPNVSATLWRTLSDLTNRIYGFESSFKPNIIWTHLDQVDFTHAAKLDLTTPLLVGDVTAQYTHTEPFRFASA